MADLDLHIRGGGGGGGGGGGWDSFEGLAMNIQILLLKMIWQIKENTLFLKKWGGGGGQVPPLDLPLLYLYIICIQCLHAWPF